LSPELLAKWSHEDADLSDSPVGKDCHDVSESERVRLVAEPEALSKFIVRSGVAQDDAPMTLNGRTRHTYMRHLEEPHGAKRHVTNSFDRVAIRRAGLCGPTVV
jgi:hypothetical protein